MNPSVTSPMEVPGPSLTQASKVVYPVRKSEAFNLPDLRQQIKFPKLSSNLCTIGQNKLRPQDVYPGLLESRVQINQSSQPQIHPYESQVKDWSFNESMLCFTFPITPSSTVWIQTAEELVSTARILMKNPEICISVKEYNNSYLDMISVLQIATPKTVFVVDCLLLHKAINNFLGNIFKNPKILKVFGTGAEIPKMNRDFGIVCVGVVVIEELRQKTLVKTADMLDYDVICKRIESLNKRCEWEMKAIPEEMKIELPKEVIAMLRVWNDAKIGLEDYLKSADLEESRSFSLKTVQLPKQEDSTQLFQKYIATLRPDLQVIFNIPAQLHHFSKMICWRDRLAKSLDVKPLTILTLPEVAFLVRASPKNINSIHSLVPKTQIWDNAILIQIIEQLTIKSPDLETISDVKKEEPKPTVRSTVHVITPHQTGKVVKKKRKNRGAKDKERSKMRALMYSLSRQGY